MEEWAYDYILFFVKRHNLPTNHTALYEALWTTKFYSPIELDMPRIDDAMILREEYIDYIFDNHINGADEIIELLESEEISCFEVLLVSAIKAMHEYCGFMGVSITYVFTMFLSNMGVYISDSDIRRGVNPKIIYINLSRWLDREYNADGTDGNILYMVEENTYKTSEGYEVPLDMRLMSIWDQVNAYILDRLPF